MSKTIFFSKNIFQVLTAISCAFIFLLFFYLTLFRKPIELLIKESMPFDSKILLKSQQECQNLNKNYENS